MLNFNMLIVAFLTVMLSVSMLNVIMLSTIAPPNSHHDTKHNDTQRNGIICDTQHNSTVHYSKCHFAECCDYLNVLLSVSMLNVVMLSIVVPPKWRSFSVILAQKPEIYYNSNSFCVCLSYFWWYDTNRGIVIFIGRDPKSCLHRIFNFKLDSFTSKEV